MGHDEDYDPRPRRWLQWVKDERWADLLNVSPDYIPFWGRQSPEWKEWSAHMKATWPGWHEPPFGPCPGDCVAACICWRCKGRGCDRCRSTGEQHHPGCIHLRRRLEIVQ